MAATRWASTSRAAMVWRRRDMRMRSSREVEDGGWGMGVGGCAAVGAAGGVDVVGLTDTPAPDPKLLSPNSATTSSLLTRPPTPQPPPPQLCDDIIFGDPPAGAAARDAAHVDALVGGDTLRDRRDRRLSGAAILGRCGGLRHDRGGGSGGLRLGGAGDLDRS